MKKFCKDLREHTTKIINYEKKKMRSDIGHCPTESSNCLKQNLKFYENFQQFLKKNSVKIYINL